MTRKWELTDIEFRVLWQRFVGTDLPRPLTFQTRTRLHEDYEQEKYQVWQRLQHTVDPTLRSVFDVLERPEVYVRLRGWNDGERDNAEHWLKARAARGGANGYLIYQLPGETPTHSGGYTVVDIGPHALAEAIVGLMPTTGAGAGGIIPLVTDAGSTRDEYAPRSSMFFEDADTSVVERSTEFFNRPAERTGTINILQNQSMFGSRGMHRDILVWRDLPADGRYVIELPNENPTATAMSRADLTDKIHASIERMMARVESHWEANA
ncbi:ESX secretion-associated protein EspG [Nocardia mangyaensis]|uniref:ESX secretion-associated protein EspG n=1 Tax=Nocardia mangyaensis TaxID=2213200 RepID=UPI00267688B3|nr:ESX secretion-associated protein EspG [Nocardia mangyaensis]MDO3647301.1 ESX secretion-associated protein EspG [Nocardia mangyaensis]